MSSNALFPNANARGESRNLLEFKAGKMNQKGKMVHPDIRSGLIYLFQSEESLMHFCWKDRTTGSVEDDLIIFPDDCEFKRVPQCTTGRVYLLKFMSSTRKFFFWLQDRNTEKDEENTKKVNDLLNNPPPVTSRTSTDAELQNLLNNMSQQQLMSIFGNVSASQLSNIRTLLGSSASPSSPRSSSSNTSSKTTSTTKIFKPSSTSVTAAGSSSDSSAAQSAAHPEGREMVSALQKLLENLGVSEVKSSDGTSTKLNLSGSMTADALTEIFNNSELLKALQKFRDEECELSSGFERAIKMYTRAMRSDRLSSLSGQQIFVNDEVVHAVGEGYEQFVKALQSANESSNDQNAEALQNANDSSNDQNDEKQAEKLKSTNDVETDAKKKDNKKDDQPATNDQPAADDQPATDN